MKHEANSKLFAAFGLNILFSKGSSARAYGFRPVMNRSAPAHGFWLLKN
jgi:hypothetical protein